MEISVPCPWCRAIGRDKSGDNLKVNVVKHTFQCFSCGARPKTHGKLDPGVYSAPGHPHKQYKEPIVVGDDWHPKPLMRAMQSMVARAYLKKRGVMPQQVNDHEIYAYGGNDRLYQQRVFFLFPEYTHWQARSIHESRRKYINAPGNKGGSLFKCMGGRDPIVLVEGVFDALAVERAGFKAIALLGKTATAEQAQNIAALTDRVLILLDADCPSDVRKLMFQMSPYVRVKSALPPTSWDPADMGDDYLASELRKAVRE